MIKRLFFLSLILTLSLQAKLTVDDKDLKDLFGKYVFDCRDNPLLPDTACCKKIKNDVNEFLAAFESTYGYVSRKKLFTDIAYFKPIVEEVINKTSSPMTNKESWHYVMTEAILGSVDGSDVYWFSKPRIRDFVEHYLQARQQNGSLTIQQFIKHRMVERICVLRATLNVQSDK